MNSWGYEASCTDPRLARTYNRHLENQNNNFIIRSKIWILFTFANTRSGYAWVQLIHCSSVFMTKQTAAACSLQLSPNSLVGAIYWVINSSDSVITTAFAQIQVERKKEFKEIKKRERISFLEKARQALYRYVCFEQGLTDKRETGQLCTWLRMAGHRQETHRFTWNYKPEFQKAQTTLKPFKLDILHFKQHTMW